MSTRSFIYSDSRKLSCLKNNPSQLTTRWSAWSFPRLSVALYIRYLRYAATTAVNFNIVLVALGRATGVTGAVESVLSVIVADRPEIRVLGATAVLVAVLLQLESVKLLKKKKRFLLPARYFNIATIMTSLLTILRCYR